MGSHAEITSKVYHNLEKSVTNISYRNPTNVYVLSISLSSIRLNIPIYRYLGNGQLLAVYISYVKFIMMIYQLI